MLVRFLTASYGEYSLPKTRGFCLPVTLIGCLVLPNIRPRFGYVYALMLVSRLFATLPPLPPAHS
jgi:hypothetical protein